MPALGRRRLDRIRPSDVEALILTKGRAGAFQAARTIYTVLRAALDIAVRDGLLAQNPAAVIRRQGVDRREATFLSTEEAQRLLTAIRGDRLDACSACCSRQDCVAVKPSPCTGPISI